MAEGGRTGPGRHAGTPASPTTETRRLVEDGGYAGRHEAPGPVQIADGTCVFCLHRGPVKPHLDSGDMVCADDVACLARGYQGRGPLPGFWEHAEASADSGEGPEGDWGPGDDDPPDYQHPDGDDAA